MRVHAFLLSLGFIFVIPWEGVEIASFGAVAQYVGFGVAAFWLATILRTGQLRAPTAFHMVVLAFALWNALSVLWSADPARTLRRATTWAQLFVFVFMLWDLYTTRGAVRAGLQAYVLGAFVAVYQALANYRQGAAFYTNYQRFSSGDTNPDGFGFILALGMPLAWYLASWESTSKLERLLRILNFAYIPVAFLGISLSGTRTALIATLPAMAFGLTSLTRLPGKARIAVVLLLAVAFAGVMSHVQTLTSFQRFGTTISEAAEGDLNSRTMLWREGIASFAKQPLTGVGADMYRSVNSLGKVAHSSFVSVLVELGVLGFLLFGSALLIVLFQMFRQSGWEKNFWLSLLMVWVVGASTLTWEHRKSTWLFFGLAVASAALFRKAEDARSEASSSATSEDVSLRSAHIP